MISVIIPVFNGEKTIGKCLECLQKQTKKPDEIIVVDDGSADRTREAVKTFGDVVLLKQEHKGPAAARNAGAKKAKGDILLFTDSDCVPDKDWVSEMAKPFEIKEIAGVQGRYRTDQKGLVARFAQLEIEDRYDRMRKREYIDFIGSYAAGYRRSVFLEFGGFDESFPSASGEDPELSFKLSKAGHKMIFNENAVVYHNHADSLRAYLAQKFWRAYWRIPLYRKHPDKMAGESYTPQTLKAQIALLGLAFLSLVASLFFQQALAALALAVVLLIITTLPLAAKNLRKSIALGLITPLITLMRTAVFSIGLFWGALRA